ncbi:helix-turn-helix domain-containing protein [Paenibacillus sp. GCM10027627]|uniref:helix-turn-helix domain-containing protein n=1 Tax=unclassified Paenibacillus TaxID=185978 RepID=UPI0036279025
MNLIGENIRSLRKQVGLTQVEFSKQIGVSQGTLSDIELGNCTPSVETVLSIHER